MKKKKKKKLGPTSRGKEKKKKLKHPLSTPPFSLSLSLSLSSLTLGSVSVAWNTSVSHAVIVGTNTSSCATYAEIRLNSVPHGRPFILTPPPSLPAVLRPASTSSSVDLPAPEGPISATVSPGTAIPEQGCSTCFCCMVCASLTRQTTSCHERSAGQGTARRKGLAPFAFWGAAPPLETPARGPGGTQRVWQTHPSCSFFLFPGVEGV